MDGVRFADISECGSCGLPWASDGDRHRLALYRGCELLSATHAGRRSSLSRSGSRCCPASRPFREWHGLLYASATALGTMMTELEE